MIHSKQRAKLRAMANDITPIFQIGKGGISENQLNDLSAALDARELIKIAVLKTAGASAKELSAELCAKLEAEPVAAIGNKLVLFRRSGRGDVDHIDLD